jgi:ribulose-5-phosphate 4-epimerase/fuculose-1-phosphate aldolase
MATQVEMRSTPGLAATMAEGEWDVRQRLASCYHLFDFHGWNDTIFNHISVRVPGPDRHFLINPFGLNYGEVTASNLVKVDLQGNAVGGHNVNYAGFLIHSAIHEAREDMHCVIHMHTLATSAVAGKADGLSHDSFTGSMLYDKVAYHDFEGLVLRPDERERIVAHMGDKAILIMRNHGALTAGHTLEEAYVRMANLQNACEIQCAADAIAGPPQKLAPDVLARQDLGSVGGGASLARVIFDAAIRRMEMARSGRYADFRS